MITGIFFRLRIFSVFLFCLLNIISTQVPRLGLIVALLEYYIVFECISKGKFTKAFIALIIFCSLTMEHDMAIYLSGEAPFERYSFFHLPIVGPFLLFFVVFFVFWNVYRSKYKLVNAIASKPVKRLKKWLIALLLTGVLSSIIALSMNDNGVLGTSFYMVVSIVETTKYLCVCCIIAGSLLIASTNVGREELTASCVDLLIGSTLSSLLFLVLTGITGFYNKEEGILLSPLVVSFSPLLLVFGQKCDGWKKMVCNITGISIIITSFFFPMFMGSKWYLILLATFLGFIGIKFGKSSIKYALIGLGVLFVAAIPILLSLARSSENTFISWKLSQALALFDFASYSSVENWFFVLEDSPKFRIDEFINISLEYIAKPFYFFFGKGFGGTTLHHTTLLYWESGNGTFSAEQIANRAYYGMHESVNVLYLRHGLFGLLFFLAVLRDLFRSLSKSPLTVIAIIWVLFFWNWSYSLWLGAMAVGVAVSTTQSQLSITKMYEK